MFFSTLLTVPHYPSSLFTRHAHLNTPNSATFSLIALHKTIFFSTLLTVSHFNAILTVPHSLHSTLLTATSHPQDHILLNTPNSATFYVHKTMFFSTLLTVPHSPLSPFTRPCSFQHS
ncbi:hypothetical protein RRG08_022457 [Elysia crispata]|uniref:Uncharacterized protein n=1 Tax=Elysia crispata TaxID=231223 RepID=A0AAE0Z2Q7_9GAST|nr:hypothetical protein RRG08_022457 [Elysia crispata]